MNRAQAADALARSTAFWSQLLAEAEAEAARHFEEVQQVRAARAQVEQRLKEEGAIASRMLVDLTREVEDLRAKLREEERVRAESQRVDPAITRTGDCCAEMRARVGGGFPFPVHFCPFCGAPQ